MDVAFPLRFDEHGRTARAAYADHVRQMIVQLLLTRPGERVMRPDFGTGLHQLVFAPNSLEVAATLQHTIQASIERWLGDVVAVETVTVTAEEELLSVVVDYRLLATEERDTVRVETAGAA
jgi:phage baseplate assembly protein W